jgi:coenzyme PQQ precursor peptide PqqA
MARAEALARDSQGDASPRHNLQGTISKTQSARPNLEGPIAKDLQDARRNSMKLEWHKPHVVEEEVGLEVTSYASAELDRS